MSSPGPLSAPEPKPVPLSPKSPRRGARVLRLEPVPDAVGGNRPGARCPSDGQDPLPGPTAGFLQREEGPPASPAPAASPPRGLKHQWGPAQWFLLNREFPPLAPGWLGHSYWL